MHRGRHPGDGHSEGGKRTDYGIACVDSKKHPFDVSKTFKLKIPAAPPEKDFWAMAIYDNQIRSQLQITEAFPASGSQTKGIKKDSDGSTDVYFESKALKGYEENWLATVPGKSWFVILRIYGALKPWLEKT